MAAFACGFRDKALLACCTWMIAAPGHCWGSKGHEIVGAIAQNMLTAHAAAQVQQQLGMSLPDAAIWLDCAKSVKSINGSAAFDPHDKYVPGDCKTAFQNNQAELQNMADYVAANTKICKPAKGEEICHKQYHYTDVAIQRTAYKKGLVGTSDHDVVAVLDAAIDKLRGRPVSAPISIKDNRQALLLIAHLVGDIHQPLHVGAVYLAADGSEIDPDMPHQLDPATETHGGNNIDEKSGNLHHEWDTVSLTISNAPQLVGDARKVAKTPGDASKWPAIWATETLSQAQKAFNGVSFSARNGTHWPVQFADRGTYLTAEKKIQREQLVEGGARLAQLLNAIWP